MVHQRSIFCPVGTFLELLRKRARNESELSKSFLLMIHPTLSRTLWFHDFPVFSDETWFTLRMDLERPEQARSVATNICFLRDGLTFHDITESKLFIMLGSFH